MEPWLNMFFQDKIYQWISRQQEGGSRVTTMDIVSYLQVCCLLLFLSFIAIYDSFFDCLFHNMINYPKWTENMHVRAYPHLFDMKNLCKTIMGHTKVKCAFVPETINDRVNFLVASI